MLACHFGLWGRPLLTRMASPAPPGCAFKHHRVSERSPFIFQWPIPRENLVKYLSNCPQVMFSNIYDNPDAIHWHNLLRLADVLNEFTEAVTTLVLAKTTELLFPAVQFSWAGDRLRMSTSRHLHKYRGWSPSMQKRCPLALCCCMSLDCKFLPRTVYDPRCENLPGLLQKLAWHRTLLQACPVANTVWFNKGWWACFVKRNHSLFNYLDVYLPIQWDFLMSSNLIKFKVFNF